MLKLLIYLCLFGLSLNFVLADKEQEEWYDFYADISEEMPPTNDDEEGKVTLHKVRLLKNDENPFDAGHVENEYDMEEYQIEDNRPEVDIKEDEKNIDSNFKLLTGDPDLAPIDDLDNPVGHDKTENNDDLDHGDFEEAINNYLDETKEETSRKDILEETKAILKEDVVNDFEAIRPLNKDFNMHDVIDETDKLLKESDDSFDEMPQSTKLSETTKSDDSADFEDISFNSLINDLDRLQDTRSKLSSDFDNTSNDETHLEYDNDYDKNYEHEYEEISDDDLDRLFKDESEEKLYEHENFRDDSPKDKKEKEQIMYINDALSPSDSTPSETTVISNSNISDANVESTVGVKEVVMSTTPNVAQESTTPQIIITKVSLFEPTQEDRKVSWDKIPAMTELNSRQLDKFYSKYISERNAHSPATTTVQVHLNVNRSTVITSPDYPNSYPTDQITDYVITGDGQGIEMNVTDFSINSFIGDYVLIKPGQTQEGGAQGILLAYSLKTERRFRFTDVDRMFIRFEAKDGMQFQRGFNMSLRNIMARTDVVDLPDPDEVITWTSNATLTVNVGGVSINGFIAKAEDFRRIIADMATMYINAKGIQAGLNSTLDVTQIRGTGLCFHNWPGSDLCTEVTFSVPLVYVDEKQETRFTKDDLRDMWDSYSGIDPFAVRLELLGIREFTYPDDQTTLTVWLVIAAGVVISMAMLAFALWRFSCFEEYTKMPSYSDTDSLNEKRVMDLYPTPHQTLPPLYTEDNIKWADDVYSNNDVGFSNKSYMQDIYDIDSDDEALRTTDSDKNNFDYYRRYTTDV